MTPERMVWNDDEDLYQPRIHSRWIRQLHRISAETGEPMTVLVDQALAEFVEQYGAGHDGSGSLCASRAGERSDVWHAAPSAERLSPQSSEEP